jgi:hypothetical protein
MIAARRAVQLLTFRVLLAMMMILQVIGETDCNRWKFRAN